MKKLVLFLAVACLILGTGVVLAEDLTNDGKAWTDPAYSDAYTIEGDYDATTNPDGYGNRFNQGGQEIGGQSVTMRVPVQAFLPCYLEFNLMGNYGNPTGQSWGPSAVDQTVTQSYLDFYPTIGGYINENWQLLAGNTFNNKDEIAPGANVYIRACDTWRARIYSNLNYKYTVTIKDGGLTREAGTLATATALLPIEMQAAVAVDGSAGYQSAESSATYAAAAFTASGADKVWTPTQVNGGNATKHTTIWQQFRVPYSREFAAGRYTGQLIATAATL